MRAARLLSIVLRLQRTGFRTAPELAEELEVSTRTIYRDVEALQAAGVPVWTVAGDGGGIHIDSQWRSPAEGLTAHEIAALLLDASQVESAGLGPALRTARTSIWGRASTGVAELLAWVDARFLVDPTPWFQPPARTDSPESLATVARALRDNRRLDLRYRSDQTLSRRRVDPLGIVQKHGIHYLVATHRQQPRTFRMSRIASAHVLDVAATVPPGFDLADYWWRLVENFESSLRPTTAKLRLHHSDLQQLRRAVPGRATEEALGRAERDGSWVLVEMTLERLPFAAQQLATIASVQVLTPEPLRRALIRHCEAILQHHRER